MLRPDFLKVHGRVDHREVAWRPVLGNRDFKNVVGIFGLQLADDTTDILFSWDARGLGW